jgi:hypothetical protein
MNRLFHKVVKRIVPAWWLATALQLLFVTFAFNIQTTAFADGDAPPKGIIRDGDARFEVLSPTLIRLEYASDNQFEERTTFNAIDRDKFEPPGYNTYVSNGQRIIVTNQLTLTYLEGSGPFTSQNVLVRFKNGNTTMVASPTWPSSAVTFPFGSLIESENTTLLNGAVFANNHVGYTGAGFVDGLNSSGPAFSFTVAKVPQSGQYVLQVRYANNRGGDGKTETRTMSVQVDRQAAQTLMFPVTANWDTWAIATLPLDLTAVSHSIVIFVGPNDSGNVNIDSAAVTAVGASYPTQPPVSLAFGTVNEAESGVLSNGLYSDNNHAGFSGTAFVAYTAAGAADTFTLDSAPADGNYSFQIRYSNGQPTNQTLSVGVGGTVVGHIVMSPTPTWDSWNVASVTVHLSAGTNNLALIYEPSDSGKVNVDSIAITNLASPYPLYHLGIGGYRRGLDGVDGSANTSPGLLYQDGWCLLDDTSTALFDSQTGAVTQRPTSSRTYQDGYLFVYGCNYQQALRDLHDLTGPAVMLPHWAYGVWFSRYYAYSASDYENTLLPAFCSEQVPLDVLVTDTDFKSPNNWNGWEFNPQYFPDPQAYFTWAHQQGLHTSLNIHASIAGDDSEFPQAQATAQGGLVLNNGEYIFNWGDPDQLTAYFGLHRQLEAAGADIFWLDWCCDSSYATINITPDSWISYNYAKETSLGGRRGFGFSRAFSSLEAGGYSSSAPVPTGPWSDHRYTVHFTGDTYSDFDTLQYEVGYTAAEGASTGLTYTSHDLGGFHGHVLPDDLYVRWVQFGTFQPIFRLHSDHGNRLPWDYSGPARAAADNFLRLREELIPYIYAAARQAYDTGLPIVRALYLALPDQPNAYLYSGTEYYFGDNLLVAPAAA